MRTFTLFGVIAVFGACATPGTRPHDMSSSRHLDAAKEAEQHVALHQQKYETDDAVLRKECEPTVPSSADFFASPGGSATPCWTMVRDAEGHRVEATQQRDAAAGHRAASRDLVEAEARACVGVGPSERDISPFFHRDDIASVQAAASGDSTPIAAIIFFRPVRGLTVSGLQRQIDCHLARNSTLGHDLPEMTYCPLVPRSVTAVVREAGPGIAVTLRVSDPAGKAEVAKRAAALVPAALLTEVTRDFWPPWVPAGL